MGLIMRILEQVCDFPRVIRAVVHRNNMILVDEQRPPVPHTVNLHWWKYSAEEQNIGDMLSPVVVQYMIHFFGLPEKTRETKHLFAIGSIIDTSYQDTTVWGSGVLNGEDKWWWRFGPVDKNKNSAELHRFSGRTLESEIKKDGIYHPFKV